MSADIWVSRRSMRYLRQMEDEIKKNYLGEIVFLWLVPEATPARERQLATVLRRRDRRVRKRSKSIR